ncbi:MAG: DUF1003 domain-containing protein [Acetobacteraceae bacterium]|nr:DUF1003 domain-containing protein [Acetobacteraceae bacterium]
MAEHPEAHHHRRHIHLRTALSRARQRRRGEGPAPELTLGERLSDLVAATVGSWRFILIQSGLLVAWLVANIASGGNAWDPYPFILLNLMLSFQAAYTAPIIMMSQNRQADIDRIRSIADYQVNIRAEAEISLLHEKIDLLREQQVAELIALLKTSLERIESLENRLLPSPPPP